MVDNTASLISVLSKDEAVLENSNQIDENDVDLQASKKSKSSAVSYNLSKNFKSHQDIANQDTWSSCNMNKQRVIEAKPTLLTPKSASKLYGKRSTLKPKVLPKSEANSSQRSPPGKAIRYKVNENKGSNLLDEITENSDDVASDILSGKTDSLGPLSTVLDDKNLVEDPKAAELSDSTITSLTNDDSPKQLVFQGSYEEQKPETIQISPTISFPVSRISNEDLYQSYAPPSPLMSFDASRSSVTDDIDSLDHSSDVSGYSYSSSVSFSREFASNPDLYNLQHKSSDQILESCQPQHEDCQKEIKELRSSLKLSEADTAILVSSKQQLQLDNQDLTESVKYLNLEVAKLRQESTEKDVNLMLLKRNSSETEKKSTEMLQSSKDNFQALQARFDETCSRLDVITLEKEEFKNKFSEISRNYETATENNKQLDSEVKQFLSKCVKLESLVNSTAIDNSDNSAYINSIRTERDEYAIKLHNVEQDTRQKQLVISSLEERLNSLNEKQNASNINQQTLLQSLNTKEALIKSLQSQLLAKDKEKEALDGAISRLNSDLFLVEASFSKIKKEMSQKAMASQLETSIKQHFESQILSLKDDLQRVQSDCRNFTQKIGDKNNQILQISEQLKRTLILKKKSDSEAKQVKSEAIVTQRSWEEAVAREKRLSNSMEMQSKELGDKTDALKSTNAELAALQTKQTEYLAKIEEAKSQLLAVEEENHLLKNELGNVHRDTVQTKGVIEKKNSHIHELENQIRHYAEETGTLIQQLESLKCERETMQLGSPPDEELANVVSQLQASRREIFEQNSLLEQEIKNLKDDLENILSEKLSLELKCNKLNIEQETWLKNENLLKENFAKLTEQLEISKQNEMRFSDNSTILSLKCASLENELVAEKHTLAQYQEDLDIEGKKLATLSNSNKILAEELETAKKEMNAANLKLVEFMDIQKENKRDRENLELFERLQVAETERSKLNEAVIQQQRYIASLQAHYQKWISDAALKFEELQSKQEAAPRCHAGSQTNHDHLPSSFRQITEPSLVDTACQTSHDEMAIPSVLADAGSQTNHDELASFPFLRISEPSLVDTGCQTSHDEMAIPSLLSDAGSQTNHNEFSSPLPLQIFEPSLVHSGCQTSHEEMAIPSVLADACSQTNQDELPSFSPLQISQPSLIDTGCQTSHEEMAIPSVLADAGSQTNLDELASFPFLRMSEPSLVDTGCQTSHKEMATPLLFSDASLQTNQYELSAPFQQTPKPSLVHAGVQTSHEEMAIPSLLSDAGSQTNHDKLSSSFRQIPEPSLVDSSCQTSHEEMVIPSVLADAGSQTNQDELPSSAFLQISESSRIDTGCQTSRDEIALPSLLSDAGSQTNLDEFPSSPFIQISESSLVDTGCHTSHDELLIPSLLSDAGSQTIIDEFSSFPFLQISEPSLVHAGCQTSHEEMTILSVLADAGSQTNHVELPCSFLQISEPSLVHAGCQTSHEETAIPSLLSDAGSQTIHDEFSSFPFLQISEPSLVHAGCQTSHEEMTIPSVLADAGSQTNQDELPSSPFLQISQTSLIDTGCQTSHEEMAVPSVLADAGSQTIHDEFSSLPFLQISEPSLIHAGCQTSHEEMTIPSVLADACSQTNHDNLSSLSRQIPVSSLVHAGCQTSHDETTLPSVLADACSQTNQDELPSFPFLQISQPSLIDTGCQTSHEEMAIPSVLADAGSQTIHDEFSSFPFLQISEPSLVHAGCQTSHEEMAVPSVLADACSQTNHDNLSSLSRQISVSSLVNAGCQTSHDEMPLPSSPLRQLISVPSVHCNDSSTQTYHDEKPLSASPVKTALKDTNSCSNCGKAFFVGPFGDKVSSEADAVSESPRSHNTVSHPVNSLRMGNDADPDKRVPSPFKSLATPACQDSLFSNSTATNGKVDRQKIHCDVATEALFQVDSQTRNKAEICDVASQTVNSSTTDLAVRDNGNPPLSTFDVATQTEHDLCAAKITSLPSDVSLSISTPHVISFLPIQTQADDQCTSQASRKDTYTQTIGASTNDVTHNGGIFMNGFVPDESTCSHCGRNVETSTKCVNTSDSFAQTNNITLPQFPDPTEFLNNFNSEDRAKLKAYKQTVKVVRGKLKQAEKQLAASKEAYSALKLELEALKCQVQNGTVTPTQKNLDKEAEQSGRCLKELESLKGMSRTKDSLIESLQNELEQMKKRHISEKEKMRRKAKADRMIRDKKSKEVNDRLKLLVDANERLRKNVEKLQVKLTNSTKELETCQREKLRYQHRARKLQADLRSLSWLSTSATEQDKKVDNSGSESEKPSFELPSSVHEIDCILKDLRKEIGVLEEQLQHHSSAVYQSNASLKELRCHDNVSAKLNEDGTSERNEGSRTLSSSEDTIGKISEIV